MQEIKAIIRPHKLDDVISALYKIEGLPGITISDIRGLGKAEAKESKNKLEDGMLDIVKKTKLEMVVHEDIVEKVIDTIQKIAHTGNPGDGKVFIYEVKDIIKIRTNERGESAI
jgi:nitrogen regulatory protein P-II 1